MKPKVLWMTGLSGSGKTTLSEALKQSFVEKNLQCLLLDGDLIRSLNPHFGYSRSDRIIHNEEIIRFVKTQQHFDYIIVSAITPFEEIRRKARAELSNYVEIFLNATYPDCRHRDTKGLYQKAEAGDLEDFTGYNQPYEIPENPDLVVDTQNNPVDRCVELILSYLKLDENIPAPYRNDFLLHQLRREALDILRATFQGATAPGLLFSGGKDSTVLFDLADQVAKELNRTFKVIHINTGDNFTEVLSFRDQLLKNSNYPFYEVIMPKVETENLNRLQSVFLNAAIREHRLDFVLGGGRRSDEKARQKELIFSPRVENGGWRPTDASAEFWPWLPARACPSGHNRVFPLSNWVEADVWNYIRRYDLQVCKLYFSHLDEHGKGIRYRTIGDRASTSPTASEAKTSHQIFLETVRQQSPERQGRLDDNFSKYALEIRKREGYF